MKISKKMFFTTLSILLGFSFLDGAAIKGKKIKGKKPAKSESNSHNIFSLIANQAAYEDVRKLIDVNPQILVQINEAGNTPLHMMLGKFKIRRKR
jgi:hypothetical protein